MRQNLLGGLTQYPGSPSGGLTGGLAGRLPESDRYAHGGNIWKLAERAGVRPEKLVDFSASINPLGDRKSTRLNSSHNSESRMPSSA
jgi:hypothetical protein